MKNKIQSAQKYLVFIFFLFASSIHAEDVLHRNSPPELPHTDLFPPPSGKISPLMGEIKDGRYYAPKNIFSCHADDFGQGSHLSQDVLLENAVCAGFYDPVGNFKKAEVIFFDWLEKKVFDQKQLKDVFEHFGLGILDTVDHAQGVVVLKEELIDEKMLFTAISIKKMSVLKAPGGKYMSATRGYLTFKDNDKLVLLSNQKVTLPEEVHKPEQHVENLRKSILEFQKTFEFGISPPPTSPAE